MTARRSAGRTAGKARRLGLAAGVALAALSTELSAQPQETRRSSAVAEEDVESTSTTTTSTAATALAAPAADAGSAGQPPASPAGEPSEELPRGTFVADGFRFRPMLEVRERFETRIDPYTATGTGPDDYFVGSRVRLGVDAGFESLRMLAEIQDARTLGQFPVGRDDGSTFGLHQGYLELQLRDGRIRLGRQEISFGRQRLLGAANWSTAGRAFDALRTQWTFGDVELDLVGAIARWVRTIEYSVDVGDPPSSETRSVRSEGDYLAGIHATWSPLDDFAVDLYALYRHDGPTEPAAGADPSPAVERSRDIVAPGLRIYYGQPLDGLSYELEFASQAGRAEDERHLAFGLAAELGYAFRVPARPGLYLGGAYATGGSPGDDITEFDNFYPTNHGHYGVVDLMGWRNTVNGFLKVALAPTDLPLRIHLSPYVHALAEPSERWASAGGATVGRLETNEERLLGYELDFDVALPLRDWFSLSAGYGVFFPAAAAENLGHSDPTHWAYLMAGSVLP